MSIQDTELDYQAGYTRILLYAEQARARGWRLTDRQLVYEILQRERAAQIREKSSLPMLGQGGHWPIPSLCMATYQFLYFS